MRLARSRSMFFYFCCIVAAATIAGCVEVAKQNANETVYRSSPWLGGTLIAFGLVVAAIGIRIARSKSRVAGFGCIGLGLLFAGAAGPSPYFDELRVTPDSFHLNVGFWFDRRIYQVDYGQIKHVDLTSVRQSGRRRGTSHYMVVHRKDGSDLHVPVGDMMEQAQDEILDHFRRRGIHVCDLRRE